MRGSPRGYEVGAAQGPRGSDGSTHGGASAVFVLIHEQSDHPDSDSDVASDVAGAGSGGYGHSLVGFRTRRRRTQGVINFVYALDNALRSTCHALTLSISTATSFLSHLIERMSVPPLLSSFQTASADQRTRMGASNSGGHVSCNNWCGYRSHWLWLVGRWSWEEEVQSLEGEVREEEGRMAECKRGEGEGAGIAFVAFKSAFTVRRALADEFWCSDRWHMPPLQTKRWVHRTLHYALVP